MSRFTVYFKKIIAKSIIEIVAVFIGITLAFFIDNYQKGKNKLELTNKYYSLLNQDLANDTAFMNIALDEMQLQIDHIDSLFEAALIGDFLTVNNQLIGIDVEIQSNNKMAIANTLLESNAFSDLYDTLIFSDLIALRQIQENFNSIDNLIQIEKIKLDERYFNVIKSFQTNTYDSNLLNNKNGFLNNLNRFKTLLEERKIYQMNKIAISKKLLVEIKSYL